MNVLRKIASLFGAAPPDYQCLAPDPAAEDIKARFRERCRRFRRLLSANKTALEAIAEVEHLLRSPKPFSMRHIRSAATRAGSGVFQMIQNINALSDNAYPGLMDSFARLENQMEGLMAPPLPSASGPPVLSLKETGLAVLPQVGGKMANLGEIFNHVGLPVPDGFAITADAYHRFMRHNCLQEEIDSRVQANDIASLDDLFSLSTSIQQRIRAAAMPQDVAEAITDQVEAMLERAGTRRDRLRLALRSSAVGEDALGASFAGQYHSELNVHPDEALDVWREIVASKYAVTAMSYRYQRGIPDHSVPMCVGVLAMVNAYAGGVAYSRDPVRPHLQCINAVRGLPAAVVDGSFSPDRLMLNRQRPVQVLEAQAAYKPFRLYCDPDGGVRRVPLDAAESSALCIDTALACRLGELALALEEYYGEPQDVEWAADEDGELVILQSRPIKEACRDGGREAMNEVVDGVAETSPHAPEASPQPSAECHATHGLPHLPPPLLRGGQCVSPGVGAGVAVILRKDADILSFPQGGILVVERAEPRWATLLSRASAVLTEAGGTAGHLASVAREYGLPAIFGLPGALAMVEALREQQDEIQPRITVDAVRGAVYDGLHPEIPGAVPRRNLMEGSPVHQTLHALSRLMVPLNLLNPESPDFSPEYCQSLHDITRFCHEKSVSLMFGEEEAHYGNYGSGNSGKQLKAGVKLKYWIVDIDDGFIKPVSGSVVELSNIRSAPMLALWHGMTAVPWAGPPATDASGFFSVVMESTMNRDLETTTGSALANHNFLMISSTFMNLQARFGYHFCTAEAQAGPHPHENYVSFQFKGGAASVDRRIARAHMVGDLLEEFGFRVDVKQDALFATAEGYDVQNSLARARLLGYLLIHTRQVDMIMHNAPQAAALRQKLRQDMGTLMHTPPPTIEDTPHEHLGNHP